MSLIPSALSEWSFGPAEMLLVAVVVGTAIVVASFSSRSLERDDRRSTYFTLVGALAAGSAMVITANSLPVVLIAWLVSGWSLVALLGFASGTAGVADARRRVARRLVVGDVALLLGLIVIGSGSDAALGDDALAAVDELREATLLGVSQLHVAAVLLVVAGASRSSLVPFHRWLIGTLVAPTPVSALVHAGLVSGAGLLLYRFGSLFVASDLAVVLAAGLGLATVVIAATASLMRADVKGALAWSTVSQMAFMVIQCAVGAFSSAIMHIVGHGMYKAALFLGAGDTVSDALRERRRPVANQPLSRNVRVATTALTTTIAVVAAVFVIAPDVSPAGRVLVVVFAWSSVAFALDGWLRRGPLEARASATVGVLGAFASAFAYVGGLRLVEALVKPSVDDIPRETIIGPVAVVVIVVIIVLFAALLALPTTAGRRSATAWWRFVLAATDDSLGRPTPDEVERADALVPADRHDLLRLAEVRADAATAAAVIAPQWPLESFVAVNPLGGVESLGFDGATDLARELLGAETHLPLEEYRADHRRGLTTTRDLEYVVHSELLEVCAKPDMIIGGQKRTAAEVIVADLLHGPETCATAALVDGQTSSGRLDEILSAWLANYVEPSSFWPAERSSFPAYARDLLLTDPRVTAALSPDAREWIEHLGSDPAAMLDAALRSNGVGEAGRVDEIRRQLCRLPGWVGLAKWRNDWAHADERRPSFAPLEIAAVRAVLELAVFGGRPATMRQDGASDDFDRRVDVVARALTAAPTEDDREQVAAVLDGVPTKRRPALWLRAQERRVDEQMLEKLDRLDPGSSPDRAEAQAVFCIDVRSEGLRRNLEAAGRYETIGFAGFFGVPMRVQRLGWNHTEARCPVLVSPAITASEHPRTTSISSVGKQLDGARVRAGVHSAHAGAKYGVGSAFALAETVGWLSGPLAAWRTLRPPSARAVPVPETRVTLDDDEILIEQRVFFAESVLKTMGLGGRLAPVVLLCGHTSDTTNNPHATALECGACAGAAGGDNARAVASLLNSPDVRHGLHERGIDVPDDTWFLAAVHDTASDRVHMLDVADAPDEHADRIERLAEALAVAGEQQSIWRTPRLPAGAGSVRDRGADWAQVRPEWGLASNAAFIIGPRSMTAGLDLEGRAFLHDYDASTDPHGRVLETIMTAPLVVGHWISAQYYFSTVDPERFGAGDKLLHNPIGATGVLTGEGGDLRVGLPLQSTHIDGRRYHQPVRLLAIIQADLEQIESTIAANPVLQSLTSGSWLRIAGRSHPHEPWSMRTPEGTWIATPRDLDAVHVRPEQMETT